MKKTILILILAVAFLPAFSQVEFRLKNSAYIYNGENNAYWEQTRHTLTYLENLLQPYFVLTVNTNIELRAGVGVLVPFNQEGKIAAYFPYVQSRFHADGWLVTVGSLDGNHNFPEPMLDPLVNMTPRVRVLSASQIPVDLNQESFPEGLDSHGLYEYGMQVCWDKDFGKGELYINWQLADTSNHRERFDVGLIHAWDPLFFGFHYWHNGGHENPHPVAITENYTAAAGIRNQTFSLLYLASYWVPDRDNRPQASVFGEGLYGEYLLKLWEIDFVFHAFVSDRLIWTNHQYIAVEGEPFYRAPVYVGLNIFKTWKFDGNTSLTIGFVNGFYWISFSQAPAYRYDQMVRADMEFRFDLVK